MVICTILLFLLPTVLTLVGCIPLQLQVSVACQKNQHWFAVLFPQWRHGHIAFSFEFVVTAVGLLQT